MVVILWLVCITWIESNLNCSRLIIHKHKHPAWMRQVTRIVSCYQLLICGNYTKKHPTEVPYHVTQSMTSECLSWCFQIGCLKTLGGRYDITPIFFYLLISLKLACVYSERRHSTQYKIFSLWGWFSLHFSPGSVAGVNLSYIFIHMFTFIMIYFKIFWILIMQLGYIYLALFYLHFFYYFHEAHT